MVLSFSIRTSPSFFNASNCFSFISSFSFSPSRSSSLMRFSKTGFISLCSFLNSFNRALAFPFISSSSDSTSCSLCASSSFLISFPDSSIAFKPSSRSLSMSSKPENLRSFIKSSSDFFIFIMAWDKTGSSSLSRLFKVSFSLSAILPNRCCSSSSSLNLRRALSSVISPLERAS